MARKDYLSWNDYFMSIALLSAERSKDPARQVGACIVNAENKIVSIGYNGMPNFCSDDDMPWGKQSEDPLENKYVYVCHAELNAIINNTNGQSLKSCDMFVTLFPCNECAKIIIQAGLKKVIYKSDFSGMKGKYWEWMIHKLFLLSL